MTPPEPVGPAEPAVPTEPAGSTDPSRTEPGEQGAPSTGSATSKPSKGQRGAVLGAMFLMATSAIGPGFITQTTAFTVTASDRAHDEGL